MNMKNLILTPRSIGIFIIISIAWFFGFKQLAYTIGNFTNEWYWLLLASFYTILLNEIFCHRICSHQLFKIDTEKPLYKTLTFLLAVDHAWSPLTTICETHANHHMYSDQGNKDNLNWRIHWYNICLLSPLTYIYQVPTDYPKAEEYFLREKNRFNYILDDIWTFFVEDNQILLTIIFWTALYFLMPIILFKIVFMGRALASVYMLLASIAGHIKLPLSYRNFDTNDTSQNNLIIHYLTLGMFSSMLHNNHHGISVRPNHAVRWFEIDLGYYIIKVLKPLLEKKV